MRKKTSLLAWLLVSLLAVGAFFVYAAGDSVLLTGSFGNSHSTGSFSTGGNAGMISFDYIPLSASGAQIVWLGTSSQTVYLTWIFWSETTGWATFSDVGAWPVIIIPPGTGSNIRDPWYLSGYAWSENAWWINMNHGEPYASGVVFLPDTTSLAWYAWSDTLGWIYFWSGSGTLWLDKGFIWKVAIGGGIAGNKWFSVLYDVSKGYDTATLWAFLNTVRKNVAIIIRNAGAKINTDLLLTSPIPFNRAMIYQISGNPLAYRKYSTMQVAFDNTTDKVRSLIVIGADIYIDADVMNPPWLPESRTIISLKNDNGDGWNIYIWWTVKKIEASLVAEKTIWSWDEVNVPPVQLSPYYKTKKSIFLDLPKNQLYIKGTTASYNTIGGSSKDGGAVCPAFMKNPNDPCTYDTALPYDWNYFRAYDPTNSARRAYPNSSKDAYSTIIEYDPRILQDPPPGLETRK